MGIVFDLYRENNITLHERNCFSKVKGIVTDIYQMDQSLPVEINKLWSLSENKVSFQWIFSKWDKERQRSDSCSIFLDGSHKDDQDMCVKFENRSSTVE